MNFADEPYVRIYTRDTKTWLKLGFEGQTVLVLTTRKLDRSGVLDGIEDPAEDVALITGIPLDIVRVGLQRLFDRGVFEHRGDRLIAPNYIEAQTCAKSDRLRQQELRERRRSETLDEPESSPAHSSDDGRVTKRDEPSREVTTVTPSHAPSQPVTLICALPSLTVRDSERARPHVASPEPESRSFTMPGPEPDREYLDAALMAGVGPEQARSTWSHYYGSGLPTEGVERLRPWLVLRAKEYATAKATVPPRARASPTGGTFGNDLDTTGAALAFHASDDDRKLAERCRLDLDRAVRDYRASPRARSLDTPTQARDFTNRLKCWAATGQWIVDGPLPQRRKGGREAA